MESDIKVIENAKIFTGEDDLLITNGTIIVEKNFIREIGSSGSVETPSEAEVIDVKGKLVLPGLIDSHLHLEGSRSGDFIKEPLLTPFGVFVARAVVDAKSLLNAGFTTVVDAGGLVALHLRQAIKEGTIPGPRIVAAGPFLSQTFGHGDEHYMPAEWVDLRTTKKLTPFASLLCDGEDECRKAARYALREGADFIKIMATGGVMSQRDRPEYPQFTIEEIKAIVEEAERAGRFVHAHAEGAEGIKNALKAGVKVIAHADQIDDDGINLALEKNAVIATTLSISEMIIGHGPSVGIPDWALKKETELHTTAIANIRKAYKAGVKIAAGTDFSGGWLPQGKNAMELKLYVEKVGMKPSEALIAATRNGAEAAGLEDKVGVLAERKIADLIVVNGNPLSDINVICNPENIVLVMKEGKVYKNNLL